VFLSGVRDACAREIAYLRAHPWDFALISWFPALVMALAWAIFAQGVNVKLPLAFVDEDHSPGSRRLGIALEAVRSTAIAVRPTTLEEAWPLVRERRAYAVLHVPPDWERRSRRGDPLPVVLYTNEQYHAAAGSITTDLVGAIESVAGDRFQINRIGLEQIHLARLLGEQSLLFVTLGLELGDIVLAEFEFFIRRHEQADDDEPDRKEEQSQEDTIPTLPNGSFTPRAEI